MSLLRAAQSARDNAGRQRGRGASGGCGGKVPKRGRPISKGRRSFFEDRIRVCSKLIEEHSDHPNRGMWERAIADAKAYMV